MDNKIVILKRKLQPSESLSAVIGNLHKHLDPFLIGNGFDPESLVIEEESEDGIEISFTETSSGGKFGCMIAEEPGNDHLVFTVGIPKEFETAAHSSIFEELYNTL